MMFHLVVDNNNQVTGRISLNKSFKNQIIIKKYRIIKNNYVPCGTNFKNRIK
jgi:hypothetical protein